SSDPVGESTRGFRRDDNAEQSHGVTLPSNAAEWRCGIRANELAAIPKLPEPPPARVDCKPSTDAATQRIARAAASANERRAVAEDRSDVELDRLPRRDDERPARRAT